MIWRIDWWEYFTSLSKYLEAKRPFHPLQISKSLFPGCRNTVPSWSLGKGLKLISCVSLQLQMASSACSSWGQKIISFGASVLLTIDGLWFQRKIEKENKKYICISKYSSLELSWYSLLVESLVTEKEKGGGINIQERIENKMENSSFMFSRNSILVLEIIFPRLLRKSKKKKKNCFF